MVVSEVMTKEIHTISPEASLEDVKNIFENNIFRHLPVMSEEKLVGIISQTDFDKIMEGAQLAKKDEREISELLKETSVEKVMTKHPFTVPPDTPVEEVMEIFYQNHFHAIPVLDYSKLVGIVSHHDVFYYILE